MNKLNIVKSVTGLIASAGAGTVVSNAIKATTPAELTKLNKVMIGVGSFAITGIVGAAASGYVEAMIDDMTDKLKPEQDETTEDN